MLGSSPFSALPLSGGLYSSGNSFMPLPPSDNPRLRRDSWGVALRSNDYICFVSAALIRSSPVAPPALDNPRRHRDAYNVALRSNDFGLQDAIHLPLIIYQPPVSITLNNPVLRRDRYGAAVRANENLLNGPMPHAVRQVTFAQSASAAPAPRRRNPAGVAVTAQDGVQSGALPISVGMPFWNAHDLPPLRRDPRRVAALAQIFVGHSTFKPPFYPPLPDNPRLRRDAAGAALRANDGLLNYLLPRVVWPTPFGQRASQALPPRRAAPSLVATIAFDAVQHLLLPLTRKQPFANPTVNPVLARDPRYAAMRAAELNNVDGVPMPLTVGAPIQLPPSENPRLRRAPRDVAMWSQEISGRIAALPKTRFTEHYDNPMLRRDPRRIALRAHEDRHNGIVPLEIGRPAFPPTSIDNPILAKAPRGVAQREQPEGRFSPWLRAASLAHPLTDNPRLHKAPRHIALTALTWQGRVTLLLPPTFQQSFALPRTHRDPRRMAIDAAVPSAFTLTTVTNGQPPLLPPAIDNPRRHRDAWGIAVRNPNALPPRVHLLPNPIYIISVASIQRIASIFSRSVGWGPMPQAAQLTPFDVGEVDTITFDFSNILAPGETLSGTPTIICTVSSGTDPTPSDVLIGAPQIGPSPITGAANMAVLQQVGNMIGGNVYTLQCLASAAPDTPSLWARIGCVQPR